MIALIMTILIAGKGVASAKEDQMEVIEPYIAEFNYTPVANNPPGSAVVTFAVAKVDFFSADVTPKGSWSDQLKAIGKLDVQDDKMAWFAFPQVANFPVKFRRAIAEVLYANGFDIKGPYESYDVIPPAYRKMIDFYLTPKIKLAFSVSHVDKPGTLTEKVEVNGTVILEIREMKSKDLIWTMELPIQKMELISEMKPSFYTMTKYNGIMNDVAKGLEQQLPSIMNSIASAVAPSEMKALKKGSATRKGKTAY